MKKSDDKAKLNYFLNKHDITSFFSKPDLIPMELFFYKKGEYICKEGEPYQYFFFFVSGRAKVYSTLSNGKALLLCFYQPLQVLGDLEIFNYEFAASNVQVMEDTYCIGININQNKESFLNDNTFLQHLCTSLGRKLNRSSKNSTINLLYPLENRLASYILATRDEDVFRANLTEISELLGTSYRHLMRTLKNFCTLKIIIKKNGYYDIEDLEFITKLAGDLYQS